MDEVKEVVLYGRCEYCHNMVAVKVPEEKEDAFDDEALSFLATQNCDCKEGDQARKQKIEIDSAKTTIDLYTKNVHEEYVRDIMCEAVEKIAKSDIKALTIKLWNGATYKMTEKDGHVVTERSETLTDSVTA